MNIGKRIAITILSIIGLALSIELCVVFYNANFVVDATPSICAISETMDCDSVARTAYSQFLGIPLSLWGVCLYLFFLFMTYVDKIKNIKFLGFLGVFKNPTSYIFCVAALSFIISIILGCISVFKINSVCIFCFMTYLVDLIIALTAKDWKKGIISEIKTAIEDFKEAISVPRYAFWFTLIVLLAIAVLTYTSVSNILSPQMIKKSLWENTFQNYNKITNGKIMGPKNAEITIHEYIDFNCPGCFYANLYLHRIVDEFENVNVEQHILPLEKNCNHNMQHEGHSNSCIKAQYALAAAKQNKYWEMADYLFLDAPENEKEILEMARLLNFDVKKLKEDANSEDIKKEIKQGILNADSKEIVGTPTLFIGMRKEVGIGSYPELKQIIIKEGGKEKAVHG